MKGIIFPEHVKWGPQCKSVSGSSLTSPRQAPVLMGRESKICLPDTAEMNIKEQIRLSAPRGAEGWEPPCAALGPNTCGDPAGTPESPASTLGASKHMQMCADVLLWAGWCGSVGRVRCVSAPRAGSWAAIVTALRGDPYETTYLAEMLSSDQNCFAALPSKSSFLPFPLFPYHPLLPFCQWPSLVESAAKQKAHFLCTLVPSLMHVPPKGARRLAQQYSE